MLSLQPNLEHTQPEKPLSAEQDDNAEVPDPHTSDLLGFLEYPVQDPAAAPRRLVAMI